MTKKITVADIENLSTDHHEAWEVIQQGHTLGLFQIESNLGRHWSKLLRPVSIDELSALVALMRPGCLKAYSPDKDGKMKNMMEHFVDRKNKQEDVSYIHPSLEKILEPTQGVMVYQEQLIAIAKEIAGFNLQEADKLRKCVTGDTRFVSKQRGWITIDELLATGYEDDDFLIMDENGVQQWKKIEKIWTTGKHNVREVVGFSGNPIKLTQYHQILTSTGWKARARLSLDDYLLYASQVEYDGQDVWPENLYYLMMLIVTEGHFVNYNDAHFVNHDKDLANFFVDCCNDFFQTDYFSYNEKTHQVRIKRCYRNMLNKLGLKFGLSGVKVLPPEFMRATLETTRKFVSLALAAEGGVTEDSGMFEFSSKSIEFIKQIQLLLLRFGVYSTLRNRKVNGETYHRLYVGDNKSQKIILDKLTWMWPTYKYEALKRKVERTIDSKNFTKDIFPSHIVKSLIDQYPFVGNGESGTLYTSDISRDRFLRIASKTEDSYWTNLATGKQRYDKIISKDKEIKERITYDFTVAGGDTPYIIANGYVIHNSVGKKDAKELSKALNEFLDGCKRAGIVDDTIAKEISELMWSSARYSFNRSHSVGYAKLAYWSAYLKANYPREFFCQYLRNAKDFKEIRAFVNDARMHGFEVCTPDIRDLRGTFYIKDGKIYYGLTNVREVGRKALEQVRKAFKKHSLAENLTPYTSIILLFNSLDKTSSHALINAGAVDFLGVSRIRLIYEYEKWSRLTAPEKEWVINSPFTNLTDAVTALAPTKKEGGGTHNKNRKAIVESIAHSLLNPPTRLVDTPQRVAEYEAITLGVSITHGIIESDIQPTATCKEFYDGQPADEYILSVCIDEVKTHTIKKGQQKGRQMAFLEVHDESGWLDNVVVFADCFERCEHLLLPDNCVAIRGRRSDKGLIVNQVKQL